jgi:hypothetical protein
MPSLNFHITPRCAQRSASSSQGRDFARRISVRCVFFFDSLMSHAAKSLFFRSRGLYERLRISFSLSSPFGKAEPWTA